MKKNLLKAIGLSVLTLLTSCGGGSKIEGTLYIGDGFNKMNAIVLKYNINSVLEEGAKISGSISAQENTEVKSGYTLAYTTINPLNATTYIEYTLCEWSQDLITTNEAKFDLTLDLKKVFPGTEETNKMYFVIHANTWDTSDLATYSYTYYKYSWDGSKVKLDLGV